MRMSKRVKKRVKTPESLIRKILSVKHCPKMLKINQKSRFFQIFIVFFKI